jgi:hypothetical protein
MKSHVNDVLGSRSRWRRYARILIYTPVLALAACGGKSPDVAGGSLSGNVTLDGSATVLPLNQAMTKAFREKTPRVQFAVDFSGTGGGFRKFCAGQVDIAAASRPMETSPRQLSGEGTDVEKSVAFREAFRSLETRIKLFLSLPLGSLDRMRLKERLDEIGRTPPPGKVPMVKP